MKKLFTSSNTLWSCLIAMVMMMASQSAWAEYVKLTALSGTGGTGGEGYASLVDTKDGRDGRPATKWGQSYNINNPDRYPAWVIVKADQPFTPQNYFLVTGNDTNNQQARQWRNWEIYGANFESDADATMDAEAWVLIDQREDADVSMQNFGVTQFTLNDEETLAEYDGTPYQYYKIVVTRSHKDEDVWLQMSEFGFGTYADFQTWCEIQAADPTKPLTYKIIEGTRNNGDNEGLSKLFDGTSSTKWGNSFANKTSDDDTSNGAYFVIKASRPICPTYYCLTTANDTGNSPGRNWKKWRIFGMNGSSDPSRSSDGWVLIDDKANIGRDQLAAANYTDCYFTLSEGNATAYKYFRVEIDECADASTYMQMGEFALGDAYTLAIARNAIIEGFGFDPDAFAEKALLEQMAEFIESIGACEDPKELGTLNAQGNELKNQIATSAKQYAELTTARNMAINQIADDDVADAILAYVNGWISDTDAIAPGEEYPVGNFAYIMANRQLTGEKAAAEAKRFSVVLLSNTKKVPEPIGDVGYEFICGTTDNWAVSEGPESLIDGNRDGTKWGTGTGGDRWLVFKANERIKPSYYGLVTGGDTHVYTDRNWKNWKIWGANFNDSGIILDTQDPDFKASDVKNSDKWVLIDVKENVGTDVLKTTSLFESYINLSIGCSEPYEYFKIEVYHSGGMQMNEFTFYNMGDLQEYRESFVEEFEGYDPLENPAYKGYTDAYTEKYEELKTTVNAPDVMKIKNELVDLQDQITSSVEKYDEYQAIYEELLDAGAASESLEAWFDGYTQENIAPNNIYRRGTYEYIMENLNLDNEAMGQRDGGATNPSSGEIGYLENMIKAAYDGVYILVDGHTVGQWGDGYYGHLIDGIALNEEGVDEEGQPITINATKWGGDASSNGDTYVIFRTLDKTNPFFYTLTTGNDTGRFPNRNWGTWYIYGGNFEGDVDATKDADGWVLIDAKENIGQDRLHPVNAEPSYFGFSTETTEKYTYYKIVVTKAYSGSQIQMNELHFGTADEFEEIKDEYQYAAKEFDYDITADQTLIDKYIAAIDAIDECQNMEALFRANYALETLRDSITASAAVYNRYAEAVETVIEYLEENNLADSEAKTILVNYLQGDAVEPSELYPNGSALYIIEEHLLADSVVLKEIDFMESLKLAAVAAGYGKGMDISSLIINRTFAKAGETLKDAAGKNLGRVAEGWDGYIYRTATDSIGKVYAAEFCNENAKFDISQTLNDMKNGFYKVTLNAGYRANGDLLSYNHAPMAYANDVKTIIPVVREDAIPEDADAWTGYAPDRVISFFDEAGDSIFVGWGMWGCEGAANAFTKGHYAITMVVQVTDGTLTIGLKNEGTQGNEWTSAGNFGLYYLGETEDDAAVALKEVADYNAARITTMLESYNPDTGGENYAAEPGFAASQRETLEQNSGVATYAAEKAIGETMQAIYETKKAYASLFDIASKVWEKWANTPDFPEMDTAFEVIKNKLDEGTYDDAAAADAAGAEFVATYPDYLEVAPYNENVDVVNSDEDSFNFTAFAIGRNPSVMIGGNFYDELTKDEVIFAFEYSADKELPASRFYIGKDADDTQAMDIAIPASAGLTQVYINLTQAVKNWGFGKTDDVIRWRFATGESDVEVGIRHARMITKAQMKAEGGTTLNKEKGDVDGNDSVGVGDIEAILTIMAGGESTPAADVDGNGSVGVGDIEAILVIMAGGE